jgi:hypothetical protein
MTEVNKKKARAGNTSRCNNKYSQSFSLKLYILRSISGITMPAPLCPARPPARTPRRRRHQTARQALYTANMVKLPTHSRYGLLGNFYYYVMTAYY